MCLLRSNEKAIILEYAVYPLFQHEILFLQARAYQGDRSFEDLKHFVEGIYQDYLIGTEEVKGDATLHDDLSKATEALNDGVPLVDAPDTTDDVSWLILLNFNCNCRIAQKIENRLL